jgi:hypothetical protein
MGGALPKKSHVAWLEERQLLTTRLRRGKNIREFRLFGKLAMGIQQNVGSDA